MITTLIRDGVSATHTKCISPVMSGNSALLILKTVFAYSSSQINFEKGHVVISSKLILPPCQQGPLSFLSIFLFDSGSAGAEPEAACCCSGQRQISRPKC